MAVAAAAAAAAGMGSVGGVGRVVVGMVALPRGETRALGECLAFLAEGGDAAAAGEEGAARLAG